MKSLGAWIAKKLFGLSIRLLRVSAGDIVVISGVGSPEKIAESAKALVESRAIPEGVPIMVTYGDISVATLANLPEEVKEKLRKTM